MRFKVVYEYVNAYDATLDHLTEVEVEADDEVAAREAFDAEYGTRHHVQCIYAAPVAPSP